LVNAGSRYDRQLGVIKRRRHARLPGIVGHVTSGARLAIGSRRAIVLINPQMIWSCHLWLMSAFRRRSLAPNSV